MSGPASQNTRKQHVTRVGNICTRGEYLTYTR